MERITSEKTTSSGTFLACCRRSALLIAGLPLVWPAAATAEVDCVEHMSRVPTGYSPATAPLRAMSLRTAAAPAAAPAARAKPARVAKARPAGVKRAKVARAKSQATVAKSGVSKPRAAKTRYARTGARRVAPKALRPVALAAADFAGPVMAVPAARRAAPAPQPLGFALVSTTVCESRPNRVSPVDYIVPGGPPPFIEDEPTDILPGGEFPPTIGPPDEPPVIGPPVIEPPVIVPPVIGPPEEPPVIGPPTEEPPVFPPVLPPGEPPFPPGEPPPTAVPEPQTWALLLTGFGLVGGLLRRSKRSLASRR